MGLLTGSAFLQGSAVINSYLPYRKKPKALQCAHTMKGTMVCCVALRSRRCDLRQSRPHSTILARLASEHPVSSTGQAFEQP
jgi:hypothetical protein